jgi:hypothetical protein
VAPLGRWKGLCKSAGLCKGPSGKAFGRAQAKKGQNSPFLSNLFACIASLPIILSFDFVLVVKGIKNKILSFLFLCI